MAQKALNKYQTSMQGRIANYFARAQPNLSAEAERELVSMISDIADLLAKWDSVVEADTRKLLRENAGTASEPTFENKEIRESALNRIRQLKGLEQRNLLPSGTVERQVAILQVLLEKTRAHFVSELSLLMVLKEYCMSEKGSPQRLKEELRKLQYEKSVAYVTDMNFALALKEHTVLPSASGLLDTWAFAHECVHDIREWRHDLNDSIFNYFLILVCLSLKDQGQRRQFFEGYMLSSDAEQKKSCASIFQGHSDLVVEEWNMLNTEIDVIRTFLDDLLVGAFDDTFKNLNTHITR